MTHWRLWIQRWYEEVFNYRDKTSSVTEWWWLTSGTKKTRRLWFNGAKYHPLKQTTETWTRKTVRLWGLTGGTFICLLIYLREDVIRTLQSIINDKEAFLKIVFETEGKRQRPGETGISKLNRTFFIFTFCLLLFQNLTSEKGGGERSRINSVGIIIVNEAFQCCFLIPVQPGAPSSSEIPVQCLACSRSPQTICKYRNWLSREIIQ